MLKNVISYRDLPLAELAKSKLESEGIYCFLANKNHIAINWLHSFALGGIKVQVRQDDFDLARDILSEDLSGLFSDLAKDFPPLEKNDFCSKCGSPDLKAVKFQRKAGALSLLLGFPFIFFRTRYKCMNCCHKQK